MDVASLSSLPVGALLWNGPEPSLTVITKMTLVMGPSGIEVAPEQEPLRAPEQSAVGCPLELRHPGDFAPRKACCDVLLTGSAYAPGPSSIIGARVKIGTLDRRFFALAAERSEAIPLSVTYLRGEPLPDAAEVTVAPRSPLHPERSRFAGTEIEGAGALEELVLPDDFDFAFFNAAPVDQQIAAISPAMPISLHGLAPGGTTVRGALPTLWPHVFVADERRGLREIQLVCDTLWIDTDRSRCELVFRGTLLLPRRGYLPARLVATLGEAFEKPDLARIEAQMSLAQIRPVLFPDDAGEELEELEPESVPEERPAATLPPPPMPMKAATREETTQLFSALEPQGGALPFADDGPRQTLILPREQHPLLSALPFAEPVRPPLPTLDLTPEPGQALAGLPFVPPQDDDVESELETIAPARPDTLVPPPVIPLAPGLPGIVVPPSPMVPPVPMDIHGPRSAPPWALAPPADPEPAARPVQRGPIETLGLFSLEKDATIQLAVWEDAASLHETLQQHGVDELLWREHRRLREKELREEAESGGNARALAAHDALERARRSGASSSEPTLDLEAYARVRAALEDAIDEPAVLASRGIELARWEQDHRHYRKQLRKDPALAERFRTILEAERIALGRPAPPKKKRSRARPRKSPRSRGAHGKFQSP